MKKDDLTGDLLSWQPAKITKEYEKQAVKAHDASAKYAKAIALTLSECPLNREEIAEQMSVILNETFSKNMLDAYAAETRPSHMISLARLEAFMQVTGDIRILSLIAKGFKQAATAAAKAKLNNKKREQITVDLTMEGNPFIIAETPVMIPESRLNDSGEWIVKSVDHTVDGNGFTTSFHAEQKI